MMDIQNLGSKEKLGVKFKDGICTELRLKLWYERDWYFCNITKSEWFLKANVQKQSPKQSLPKVSSEAVVRKCS